jgi:hypothetical protein
MPFAPSIPKIAMPKTPDPHVDPAGYLRSIESVRERCSLMLGKARANKLNHFDVNMAGFKDTTKFVVSIMKVRGKPLSLVLLCLLYARETDVKDFDSEIMPRIMLVSLHMAVGSISMWVGETVSRSFQIAGRAT